MRRIGTCLNCPDRHPACHDSCQKYKAAYDRETELLNKVRQGSRADREHMNYMIADKEKRRKK